MTTPSPRTVSIWVDRVFRAMVILGLLIALVAIVRDLQTRDLADRVARDRTNTLCVGVNARWEAYFDAVTKIANKPRPGETPDAYQARKAQTTKLVQQIRRVTVLDCKEQA